MSELSLPSDRIYWFKQKFIRDKIKIQRIIMRSSTRQDLFVLDVLLETFTPHDLGKQTGLTLDLRVFLSGFVRDIIIPGNFGFVRY